MYEKKQAPLHSKPMNPSDLLKGYDQSNLSIGVLGGHSALDCCHGAKKEGFKTVCVARKGREKTYKTYYGTRDKGQGITGCVDETIVVDAFEDVLRADIVKKLRSMNTIFIQNRYFWVYVSDYSKVENDFNVPIFGNRTYVKIEERDQKYNQYHLLRDAGIRTPKIFTKPEDIDRPVIVKASEVERGVERAFFIVSSTAEYDVKGAQLERSGKISSNCAPFTSYSAVELTIKNARSNPRSTSDAFTMTGRSMSSGFVKIFGVRIPASRSR